MNLMNWNVCARDFIRKIEIDNERIKSIMELAMDRLEFARMLEKVSFKVENYYEVIKELLIAYLLKNGLKSKNHQCLISYFYKENPDYEKEAQLISQMSFFRNRLGYYGEKVPEDFFEENKEEFEKIVKILLDLINKEVSKK